LSRTVLQRESPKPFAPLAPPRDPKTRCDRLRPAMGVSREKLYEEVWAEPMTTVAKRYDVTSNFLARICEQLNVPRPSRGYWQQLKVGRGQARPPLSAPRPGDELEWIRAGDRARAAAVPRAPVLPKRRKKIDRPARHPLLVGVLEDFLHSRVIRRRRRLRPTLRLA